jgi:hypothetical protein
MAVNRERSSLCKMGIGWLVKEGSSLVNNNSSIVNNNISFSSRIENWPSLIHAELEAIWSALLTAPYNA